MWRLTDKYISNGEDLYPQPPSNIVVEDGNLMDAFIFFRIHKTYIYESVIEIFIEINMLTVWSIMRSMMWSKFGNVKYCLTVSFCKQSQWFFVIVHFYWHLLCSNFIWTFSMIHFYFLKKVIWILRHSYKLLIKWANTKRKTKMIVLFGNERESALFFSI